MSFYDMVRTGQFGASNTAEVRQLTNDVADLKVQVQQTGPSFRTRGTVPTVNGGILSATEMKKGLLVSSATISLSLTTPTAAEIIAADPDNAAVDRGYQFSLINTAQMYWYGINLAAGHGVTLVGQTYIGAPGTGTYYVIYDNVTAGHEAVTIYRI